MIGEQKTASWNYYYSLCWDLSKFRTCGLTINQFDLFQSNCWFDYHTCHFLFGLLQLSTHYYTLFKFVKFDINDFLLFQMVLLSNLLNKLTDNPEAIFILFLLIRNFYAELVTIICYTLDLNSFPILPWYLSSTCRYKVAFLRRFSRPTRFLQICFKFLIMQHFL